MAEETNALAAQVSLVLQNFEAFDFEDRKALQFILLELSTSFPEVLESTFYADTQQIVKTLVAKYGQPGMATFVGKVLRLFTKSSVRLYMIKCYIEIN